MIIGLVVSAAGLLVSCSAVACNQCGPENERRDLVQVFQMGRSQATQPIPRQKHHFRRTKHDPLQVCHINIIVNLPVSLASRPERLARSGIKSWSCHIPHVPPGFIMLYKQQTYQQSRPHNAKAIVSTIADNELGISLPVAVFGVATLPAFTGVLTNWLPQLLSTCAAQVK